MRFHKVFRLTSEQVEAQRFRASSAFACRAVSSEGFPVQRIVVGCAAPRDGSAHRRRFVVYAEFLEDETGCWFELGSVTIGPGELGYFDLPVMMSSASAGRHDVGEITISLRFCPVEDDLPDGEHVFAVGADISSPGL